MHDFAAYILPFWVVLFVFGENRYLSGQKGKTSPPPWTHAVFYGITFVSSFAVLYPLWEIACQWRYWLWHDQLIIDTTHPTFDWLASFCIGFLAIDFLSYLTHRLEHASPLLMRVHCVHHADHAIDSRVALSFHPIEIMFNIVNACLVWVFVATPYQSFLAFSLVSNVLNLWHHTQLEALHVPSRFKWLDRWVATPQNHHVHHIGRAKFFRKNLCNIFSFWDVLFGTYQCPYKVELAQAEFGMPYIQAKPLTVIERLTLPLYSARTLRDGLYNQLSQ